MDISTHSVDTSTFQIVVEHRHLKANLKEFWEEQNRRAKTDTKMQDPAQNTFHLIVFADLYRPRTLIHPIHELYKIIFSMGKIVSRLSIIAYATAPSGFEAIYS